MKFRVERDALADAVAWTAKSLPNRPSVPVLAGVLGGWWFLREGKKRGMVEEMKEGFRFVAHRPTLQLLTFLAFAGTFLGMPIVTFLPVVAKSIFGLGAPTSIDQVIADHVKSTTPLASLEYSIGTTTGGGGVIPGLSQRGGSFLPGVRTPVAAYQRVTSPTPFEASPSPPWPRTRGVGPRAER